MSVNEKMTVIADAIRSYTGGTEPLGLDDMGQQVQNVYLSGVYDVAYESGYQDGQQNGRQAAYDAFWDMFQENGNRTYYRYAFAYTKWDDANFNPKYPLKFVGEATYAFMATTFVWADKVLQVDLSEATGLFWTFRNTKITRLGKCDLSAAIDLTGTFSLNPNLVEIQEVVSRADLTWNNTFSALPALEQIRFSGVIGSNGLDLSSSTKLNEASIESIINALSDTTSGLSITLSLKAVDVAFDEECHNGSDQMNWIRLVETKPNWTINLV